ncbi:MAG: response regulator [Anaerolineae bacterium]|nr:response regulator [Anaerolineae bacterium]
MSTPNILVIDSDEGFGNMLKEGLNGSGQYQATCVHTGREAMQLLTTTSCDLVIIDMGIGDVSPVKLIKAIRKAKTEIRIMLIPIMGQELPDRMEELLKIDGVLTKPFFVGDLPDLVNEALGIEAPTRIPTPPPELSPPANSHSGSERIEPTPAPTAKTKEPHETSILPQTQIPLPEAAKIPQETLRYLRANETEILRILDDLHREVRAEAILLIAGQELIAQAGMLKREQCLELSALVAQSSLAAAQAASFLGEKGKRFDRSLHEGSEYRVYTLTISAGILLSIALSSNVPLGMIRHQSSQIAKQLEKFI